MSINPIQIVTITYEDSLTYKGIEGEVLYVEMLNGSKKLAIFRNGTLDYIDAKVAGEGLSLNLYDLNKQAMEQFPELTDEQIAAAQETVNDFYYMTGNKYHMLYGKEISYFTLFCKDDHLADCTFSEGVFDCISDLGALVSVEQVEEAIEFWIKTYEGETTCLYLFPYDSGVVIHYV